MKLELNTPVNPYYVQTLVMTFFPGEKFGEKDGNEPDSSVLSVETEERETEVLCRAFLRVGEQSATAEKTVARKPAYTPEKTVKMAVGEAVLTVAGEILGYRPSWGMLTGVRPSKVATAWLEEGVSKTEVKRRMTTDFLVTPKKASLAIDVARNEANAVKKASPKDCSVYLSIPFCPTRCSYCSFVSYTSKRLLDLIPEYLTALLTDMRETFSIIRELGMNVKTVYIGGGTPTILTPDQLRLLLSAVAQEVDVSSLEEFTLESGRPDTITPEKFAVAREYGVDRVSVNPQTLSDEVLAGIGRHHTVEDFFRAYAVAREAGFRTVNVDMIAGLPGDNFRYFSKSLDQILALSPENLTVHTFCIKKSAEILRQNSHVYNLRGGDAGKCVDYAQLRAAGEGYIPYYMYRQKNTVGNFENVGFARPGHEGLYNIYMMEELHTIFAAGAGAVTKLMDNRARDKGEQKIERIFRAKYPYEYLREENAGERREKIFRFFTECGIIGTEEEK